MFDGTGIDQCAVVREIVVTARHLTEPATRPAG